MKCRSFKNWMCTTTFALLLSPLAALAAGPININTADALTLEQIKGIGPVKAQAIVDYRSTKGPFASVDDLVNVPGIGPKSVQAMRESLTTGGPAPTAAANPPPKGNAPTR
jgi:competence protein ComEA